MRIAKQEEYELGDKVLIRDWDDMAKEYGVDIDGNIITSRNHFYFSGMRKYCRQVGVICNIDVMYDGTDNCFSKIYSVKDNEGKTFDCVFTSEMIAGKVIDNKDDDADVKEIH